MLLWSCGKGHLIEKFGHVSADILCMQMQPWCTRLIRFRSCSLNRGGYDSQRGLSTITGSSPSPLFHCWEQMPGPSLRPLSEHSSVRDIKACVDSEISAFIRMASYHQIVTIKLQSHLQTMHALSIFQRLADLAGRMGSHIWIKVFTFFFQKFSRVLVTEEEGRETN